MKTKHLALPIAALLFVAACKKNEYNNTTSTTQPVFSFSGVINNSPITIQAGVNNYYMNTSYSKDSNGVYDYTGEFMGATCTSNCPNSLVFYFKDSKQYPVLNEAHIDSLLTSGYYSYAAPEGKPPGYYEQFYSFFNGTALSYSWNFGDGHTGTGNAPINYYYHPGIYQVILTINSTSCSSTDTNYALVGQIGNAFSSPFSNGSWTVNSTTFNAVPNGVPPYSYLWNFGDGSTSNSASPTHNFTTGIYEVTCTNTDALGYTAVERMNIATPSATGCAGGFFDSIAGSDPNPLNLNDVGIEWYDGSGALWKSENNKQHHSSLFLVSAVSDYKNNSAGQPVKMITAKVSCELYNGLDSIPLTGNVVFGVAHF